MAGSEGRCCVYSQYHAHHVVLGGKSFQGVARLLQSGCLFIVYGPFNYGGQYTSDSNARFDRWLKVRDADSGIRDFEAVDKLARHASLEAGEDTAMPANNRLLIWRKI